jgi:hypothetical protein
MLLSRRRVCPLFLIVFRGLRSRLRGQQSRRWRSLSSGRSPHASATVAASSGDAERASLEGSNLRVQGRAVKFAPPVRETALMGMNR